MVKKKNHNNIQLICSIMKYDKIINIENLVIALKFVKEQKYLIRIHMASYECKYYKHSDYLFEYIISISEFLYYINETDNFTGLFESVFARMQRSEGRLPAEGRSVAGANINNDVLFIFEDIEWYNIVLMFKLKNIMISGGTITRRHKLNSVECNLITFLMYLEKFKIDRNLIYENYHDKSLNNFYNEDASQLLIQQFNEQNQKLNSILMIDIIKTENEKLLIKKEKSIKFIEEEIKRIDNNIKQLSSISTAEINVKHISKKELRDIRKGKKGKTELMKEKLDKKIINLKNKLIEKNKLLIIEKSNLIEIKNKIKSVIENKYNYSHLKHEYTKVSIPLESTFKIIIKISDNIVHRRRIKIFSGKAASGFKKDPVFSFLNFIIEIISDSNNDIIKAQKDIERLIMLKLN